MKNIIPIVIGLVLILAKEKIMDYYDYFNHEYSRPLNRKIWAARLMTAGVVSIALGILRFFLT